MNTVKIYGSTDSDCGYCKGARAALVDKSSDACSKAYTIVATNLEPKVYEELLHRGWRRSGIAIYKPDNWNSCCPALTIRLPVQQFTPSRGQRKILKKMDHLLFGSVSHDESATEKSNSSPVRHCSPLLHNFLHSSGVLSAIQDLSESVLSNVLHQRWPNIIPNYQFSPLKVVPKQRENSSNKDKDGGNIHRVTLMSTVCAMVAGKSRGTVNRDALSEAFLLALHDQFKGFPFFPLKEKLGGIDAASFKRHRIDAADAVAVLSVDRHATSGQLFFELSVPDFLLTAQTPDSKASPEEEQDAEMKLLQEDKLFTWWRRAYPNKPLPVSRPVPLSITSLRAHESALDPDVHRLYWKYQSKVHGDADPFTDSTQQPGTPSDWATRAPSGWLKRAETVLEAEYAHLPMERYERLKASFRSFYEFLVENPFGNDFEDSGDAGQQMGTIHQHYRLANGLLIAVGVVDVLPQGLSSVYLFYDPTFSDELVPLGKYSILKEIEWTQRAGLPYYYLGYYIESCQKMRYKAEYKPSQLLCPTTYEWIDAEVATSKIKQESPIRHCCTLSRQLPDNATAVDIESFVNQIQMDIGQDSAITIPMLTPEGRDIVKPILLEFLAEASPQVAVKCIVDLGP